MEIAFRYVVLVYYSMPCRFVLTTNSLHQQQMSMRYPKLGTFAEGLEYDGSVTHLDLVATIHTIHPRQVGQEQAAVCSQSMNLTDL